MNREALLAAAEEYSHKARQWFREGEAALREKEKEIFSQARLDVPGLREAVTDLTTLVRELRADQDQIHEQLRSAFAPSPDVRAAAPTQPSTHPCVNAALLALDRSIEGWLRLKDLFPDQEDTVLPLLVHLDRLRRAVEKEVPEARSKPRSAAE